MANFEDDFADMQERAKARKKNSKPPPPKKLSEMSLVDRYEVERKMGRFTGTFKEFLDKMNEKKKATPSEMKKGGMTKKYNMGGVVKANCGASVKPSGASRKK